MAPKPTTIAEANKTFFSMVFPPKADETGTGSPRSAAPIHHAAFKAELPFANQQTFENRPNMRGTDKETFGGGYRILEVFLFFGKRHSFPKNPANADS